MIYKFSSISLTFGQDRTLIERRIYGTLDWLADCGGLLFALAVLGSIFVAPFASQEMKSVILSQLFKYVMHKEKEQVEDKNENEDEDADVSKEQHKIEESVFESEPGYDNEDYLGDAPSFKNSDS